MELILRDILYVAVLLLGALWLAMFLGPWSGVGEDDRDDWDKAIK